MNVTPEREEVTLWLWNGQARIREATPTDHLALFVHQLPENLSLIIRCTRASCTPLSRFCRQVHLPGTRGTHASAGESFRVQRCGGLAKGNYITILLSSMSSSLPDWASPHCTYDPHRHKHASQGGTDEPKTHHTHIHTYIHTYIYIYTEREEGETESERKKTRYLNGPPTACL